MRKRIIARAYIMFCLPLLSTAVSTAEGRTGVATEPAAGGGGGASAATATANGNKQISE